MLGHLSVEYDFHNHVASDVAIGQLFLETRHHKPTSILLLIGQFRTSKKKSKTNYIVLQEQEPPSPQD